MAILITAGLFNAWIFHSNWNNYFRKDPIMDHGTIFKYDMGDVPIPDTIWFAGTAMPMTQKRFRKAIYKALKLRMRKKALTIYYLKQAARWNPEISKILKLKQLPDDLKFIPLVESNYTNATSPMGAKGFWQLIPMVGKKYGLIMNETMDQRLDPWASTAAATKLLINLYDTLKSWPMVIGGYNVGIYGILNKMKNQKEKDFFKLKLSAETESFLPKLISYKLVMEFPQIYGFSENDWKNKSAPFEFFTTDSAFSAGEIEQKFHLAAGTVRKLNPWLFGGGYANSKRQTFHLRIR